MWFCREWMRPRCLHQNSYCPSTLWVFTEERLTSQGLHFPALSSHLGLEPHDWFWPMECEQKWCAALVYLGNWEAVVPSRLNPSSSRLDAENVRAPEEGGTFKWKGPVFLKPQEEKNPQSRNTRWVKNILGEALESYLFQQLPLP